MKLTIIVLLRKTAVSSNYSNNIYRTYEMSLINCEINLTLTWQANCVIY